MDEQHNTIIREQEYSDAATQRTIIDLIDAESGEFIDANMLDTMTEAELTELKELQSLAKKSGKYKYVCAVCGQPLRLDSRHYASRRYKSYFFSHYSNGDDCPLKTSSDAVDPVRSTINWYGKFKESKLHKDMCQKLMQVLSIDERFSKIESYPTINIYGENVHWHKPDVASDFYGNQLVFETLMYNTFLSSIVEKNSFYRMANSFLLWVFPHFSIDNQTMCEKDVYYTHRRNIFVFDSEDYYRTDDDKDSSKPQRPVFAEKGYTYAQEESIKRGRLMLNCYWQIPVIQGEEVKIEWHHKLVDISELTFDAIKKDAFFHNCDYDFKEVADPHKRELIENWERAKEDRWSKIFQGIEERKERFEAAQDKKNIREKEENILSNVLAGQVVPEPIKIDDKYGYKADDTIFIKPQYGMAWPFRNGLAIVANKRGKRGVINLRNERVFDIKYDKLSWLDVDNPTIIVCNESPRDLPELYNVHGEKVLDYQIKGIKKINGNFVFIKYPDTTWGVLSSDGTLIAEPFYAKIAPKDEDKYIFKYDGRTKTVLSDLSDVKTKIISEVLPGKFIAERLLLWGIVDAIGNSIVPFGYSKIERFSDNYLLIEATHNCLKRYGLMDNNLEFVLPLDTAEIEKMPNGCLLRNGSLYNSNLTKMLTGYSSIEPCPDGNYILSQKIRDGWKTSYQYGLADKSGSIIFPCISPEMVKNEEGNVDLLSERLDNGECIKNCFGIYVLFDQDGKPLTDRAYNSMKPLPNGNILVTCKGKTGIIDLAGNEIVKCTYDNLDLTESGDVGTSLIPIDNYCSKSRYLDQYALCDSTGSLLTEHEYDDIFSLANGFYLAEEGFSQYILDKLGKSIFTSSLSESFVFLNQELIEVKKGKLCGIINIKGNIIVPVEFSTVELLPNGNIKLTKESDEIGSDGQHKKLYGLYKNDGSIIVECNYFSLYTDGKGNLSPSFENLTEDHFAAHQMDKYALANSQKELLTDFSYDSLKVFDDNYFLVEKDGEIGLIDKKGQVLLSNVPNYNVITDCLSPNEFVIQHGITKGVVNHQGAQIIPQQFSNIVKLPNNTWKVEKIISNNILYYPSSKYYGIYKENGDVLYDCVYKELVTDEKGEITPTFSGSGEKVFKARMLDKYALCSDERTIITDYIYDDILEAGNHYYVIISGHQQGVIDLSGKVLLPLSYRKIITVIDEGHFIIQHTNQLGQSYHRRGLYKEIGVNQYVQIDPQDIIDNTGTIIFSSNYPIELNDRNQPVTKICLSLGDIVASEFSGKYAIGKDSDIALSDYVYDSVEKMNDSLVIVSKDDKYGIVNSEGELILPAEYSSEFESLSLGIVKFCKADQYPKLYGLCDSSGKVLAEPIYTFIRENNPGHFKLFYQEGREQKSKYLDLKESKEFVVGQQYKGKVGGIQEYGIFINVYGCGAGLLHIKQLRKVGKEPSSFSKGDTVSVKVINIRKDGKVEFSLVE